MKNVEMFKKIHNQITLHPETHHQGTFEEGQSCGTTRCVAGWAIHLWGVENGFAGSVNDLMGMYVANHMNPNEWVEIEDAAGHLLGLSEREAYQLFYNFNEPDVVRMVSEYAAGKEFVQRDVGVTTCDCGCQ